MSFGFADALFEPIEFLDESLLSSSRPEGPRPSDSHLDASEVAEAVEKARRQLNDSLHGAAPAPYKTLELMEGSARWSIEEGYAAEEDAIAELLPSRQAQASLYAFDLVERRRSATRAGRTSKRRRSRRSGSSARA